MHLDHGTGTMSGTVLRGRFQGRYLDELTLDELMASRDMRNRRLSRAASHVERPARVCVWTGHGKGHGHFYIMNLAEGARNAFRPS